MWISRPRKAWSGNSAAPDRRLGRACPCLLGEAGPSGGGGRVADELPEPVHRPRELPVLKQLRSPSTLVERNVAAPVGKREARSSPCGPRLAAGVLHSASDVVRAGQQVARLHAPAEREQSMGEMNEGEGEAVEGVSALVESDGATQRLHGLARPSRLSQRDPPMRTQPIGLAVLGVDRGRGFLRRDGEPPRTTVPGYDRDGQSLTAAMMTEPRDLIVGIVWFRPFASLVLFETGRAVSSDQRAGAGARAFAFRLPARR